MGWYRHLTSELLESAYKAGQELAWSKRDALRVIEILSSHNYVILGVDIWIPTEGGPTIPTPFVYDWSLGQESPQRERKGPAKDFVKTFEWDPADHSHGGREPYFNIMARARES